MKKIFIVLAFCANGLIVNAQGLKMTWRTGFRKSDSTEVVAKRIGVFLRYDDTVQYANGGKKVLVFFPVDSVSKFLKLEVEGVNEIIVNDTDIALRIFLDESPKTFNRRSVQIYVFGKNRSIAKIVHCIEDLSIWEEKLFK